MTAEVHNLRTARRQKARRLKEAEAAQNRLKFGTSTAAKRADAAEEQRRRTRHAGHRIAKPGIGEGEER